MTSTFHGLETARRGMYTQQSALHTTGQNIANANTPGYSRQRVNFEQTEPFPPASMNRPQIPGQIGTGVKAGSVQRVREEFLDVQYRGEATKTGYWEARQDSLKKMEEIMNEPSESGLSNTMDMFWQSLQDLAVNPTNAGARSVVSQRGLDVTSTFHYLSNSLTSIKEDYKSEIEVSEKAMNSILEQIDAVNNQIGGVEPHGYVPNDLYDERDRLIDQLSEFVNVNVTYEPSGGNQSPIAMGKAIVKLVNGDGTELGTLVNASGGINQVKVNFDGTDDSVKTISVGGSAINYSDWNSSGKIKALVETYGYQDGSSVTGLYPDMLSELDNLAYTFAQEFNAVHISGMSPNEINNGNTPADINFFEADASGVPTGGKAGFASRIQVSQDILHSIDNIATADGTNPATATLGDNSNIRLLSDVINKEFDYSGNSELATFRGYYESVIGGMAVDSATAVRLAGNSGQLKQSVENRRMQVSSVSVDEEMTNMIQFQHAYNASARMISLTDELLDKVINGMGTGGR
ncbi:flagellar hook-associated protein FlgK [Bacillus sp. HMF5848]|uniref:flagellar hook-associated protein FlgK n=1 Tax=Bacillus sp. HMF5848 TaxID=2495421 RepID=UPI000F7A79AA|nr:flagellar hook-associated protein FlgK [Bacillus sp. HMF5848]RSK28624.1 flagellar hook-associated protein FlgK [Bacillus sp. HMF5848]